MRVIDIPAATLLFRTILYNTRRGTQRNTGTEREGREVASCVC